MAIWEYDTVFYRVSCIALVAVALTFALIVTNVFVDLDVILTDKNKGIFSDPQDQTPQLPRIVDTNLLPNYKSEEIYDEQDYFDSEDLYRDKRSLDHGVIIKTIMDFTAPTNDRRNKNYDNYSNYKFYVSATNYSDSNTNFTNNLLEKNSKYLDHKYYQNVYDEYLVNELRDSTASERTFTRRPKRQIKMTFNYHNTTTKPYTTKKDEDEILVEIETHFNNTGSQGEQKKKLVKDLIEKIQNAIQSDKNSAHKKKQRHLHVKKRTQNPLSSKSAAVLINKLILPFDTVSHRHLDPITKDVHFHEKIPLVANAFDHHHWQEPYHGPRFFNKFINSAESNTFDSEYNKVMKLNGIPQRLQKPLNTGMSEELVEDVEIPGFNNMDFFVKDIDGSGFSIGFNQYTDEAPDPQTIFSGLENIIPTYHHYNQGQDTYDEIQNITPVKIDQTEQKLKKIDQHVIRRRSIQDTGERKQHGINNEITKPGFSYKNLNRIRYHDSDIKHVTTTKRKNTFILDENVFEKNLKPSEIFSIADFFQRRKRYLEVKRSKVSNVEIRNKMDKYINIKGVSSKKLFKNNKKRSKRQISKIKIIAKDLSQHKVFEGENTKSDESILANRALYQEIELPDIEPKNVPAAVDHYDILSAQKYIEPYEVIVHSQNPHGNHYGILTPYIYEPSQSVIPSEFSRQARDNSLMSKYPHIILEEDPNYLVRNNGKYGEEFTVDTKLQYDLAKSNNPSDTNITNISIPSINDQDISDFVASPDTSNYKVSVKIRPKNVSNVSGFKEIHTSINKSYNRNGLMFTSLVNVSELSKVEKLNNSDIQTDKNSSIVGQNNYLRQQQETIKSMIRQHKKRLDQQLKNLQMERMKLETMNVDSLEFVTDTLPQDYLTAKPKKNQKPNQSLAKNKHKIESNITKGTLTISTTTLNNNMDTSKIEISTKMPDDHAVKGRLIETIEKNEKITNILLKKIDQNTGVLEAILQKIMKTIENPTRNNQSEEKSSREIKTLKSTNKKSRPESKMEQSKNDITLDHHLRNKMPLNFEDYQYMSNILFGNIPKYTNKSFGIPFIYAVQNPAVVPSKEKIASIVYRGHIHANALSHNGMTELEHNIGKMPETKDIYTDNKKIEKKTDSEFWKPKPGEKVIHDYVMKKNKTKYFLDEPRNNFKIPLLSKNNITKV